MNKEEFTNRIIKKRVKKQKSSYSINENVLKRFNDICKNKNFNKSQIIENLIVVFIENIEK